MKKIKLLSILMSFLIICAFFISCSCSNENQSEPEPEKEIDKKPVLYLYPEEKTDVKVKLSVDGTITSSYPKYANGWTVTAYPDGRLINKADNSEHFYLFWESALNIDCDMSEGFVVKSEDTEEFLREKLSYMGLLPREYNDFIVFWLPVMKENKYNLISFQEKSYTDVSTLGISPKPDSLLRIMMAFKSLERPVNIPEQKLDTFERKGFTAIEWGEMELN